jgi:hypothetical protein
LDYFSGNVRPEIRLATHSAGRLLQGDLMLSDLADLGVEDDDLYFVLDLQRFEAAATASRTSP